MMIFAFKNEKLCIKNEEFCTKNDEFRRQKFPKIEGTPLLVHSEIHHF